MPIHGELYDAETRAVLRRAYEDAWHDLQIMSVVSSRDEAVIRWKLVTRILQAAAAGERDPDRLKLLALHAIDGPHPRRR